MSFAEIYFGVVGVVLATTGIALLVNFRGLARHWESQVNALSAEVNRLARLPWPANPFVGPEYAGTSQRGTGHRSRTFNKTSA